MRHELFIYQDDDRLARQFLPYIEAGLDAGEAVVAVIDERKIDLLRDALGPRAAAVEFAGSATGYTRPEGTVAAYDRQIRDLLRAGSPGIRVFGEFPPLDGPRDWDRWTVYEAVLNRAFDELPVSIMCSYDRREVPGALVEQVARAHPRVNGSANPRFEDPAEILRATDAAPGPLPTLAPVELDRGPEGFRRALVRAMRAPPMAPAVVEGMLLAATEAIANAFRHGDGEPDVRVGRGDGWFVCEVTDHGRGFDDPFAGHLPPASKRAEGAGGLWVARQLTAHVELLASPDGMTVRLWAPDGPEKGPLKGPQRPISGRPSRSAGRRP